MRDEVPVVGIIDEPERIDLPPRQLVAALDVVLHDDRALPGHGFAELVPPPLLFLFELYGVEPVRVEHGSVFQPIDVLAHLAGEHGTDLQRHLIGVFPKRGVGLELHELGADEERRRLPGREHERGELIAFEDLVPSPLGIRQRHAGLAERAEVPEDRPAAHTEVFGQIARAHVGTILQKEDRGEKALGPVDSPFGIAHEWPRRRVDANMCRRSRFPGISGKIRDSVYVWQILHTNRKRRRSIRKNTRRAALTTARRRAVSLRNTGVRAAAPVVASPPRRTEKPPARFRSRP